MDHPPFLEDDATANIDWDKFFTDLPENLFDFDFTPLSDSPVLSNSSPTTTDIDGFSNPSPDSFSSWIDEIEGLLMEDDDGDKVGAEVPSGELCDNVLADVIVESSPPPAGGGFGEVVDARNDSSDSDAGSGSAESVNLAGEEKDSDGNNEVADDHASKKRRRQLRNRDAAVKSRERKKLYVRDLEIKSKYFEGECRRLERLLQCFVADNHALRLTLQNGSVATMTKQESAVLLLESLLLGSLLWFLGLTCMFMLPLVYLLTLKRVPQKGNAEKKSLARQAPRKRIIKMFTSSLQPCFNRSRRCRSSRTRMRLVTREY